MSPTLFLQFQIAVDLFSKVQKAYEGININILIL